MLTPNQHRKRLRSHARKIAAYIEREGTSPSVREFRDMAGMNSSSHAILWLRRLEQYGFIKRKSTPRYKHVITVLKTQ